MNSGSSEIVVLPQRDLQFRVTKKCCLTLDRCRMIGFYLAQGWTAAAISNRKRRVVADEVIERAIARQTGAIKTPLPCLASSIFSLSKRLGTSYQGRNR